MSKTSKILIISELVFLASLFIVLPTVFIRERSGIHQTSFENILPLDINHIYIQSFSSDRDHLNSISVLLKNPGLDSSDMVYIEIQNSNHENLHELSLSGRSIGDPSWINFEFPVLDSKKEDIFYIKVNSDCQKDNLLYIYGNNQNKSINFKTTYKNTSLIDSLRDNLNHQKERFLELNQFQLSLYLVILIITNILIRITL